MALHDIVSSALASSFGSATDSLQRELRVKALIAGWPSKAANSITVTHENGGFHATAGPEADDWEYGSSAGRPPLSVVRLFNSGQAQTTTSLLQKHLHDNLGSLLS